MEIIYPLKMLRYVLQEDKLLNIFNNPLTLTASKIVLSVFGLYTATKVALWLRLVYHTIGRDLGALYKLLKTKFRMSRFRRQNATVAKVFKEVVKRHPDKPLVYSNDQMWTFREMDEFSNRIANFFIEQGYSPGDEAALFMESKPEFIGIWLGLAKAGLVTALINTNQRKESLIHSIISVSSKALIYGPELEDAVLEAYPSLHEKRDLKYFCFPKSLKSGLPVDDLEPLIEKSCTEDPAQLYLGNYTDKVLYIYTSGTTGLPKAAVIKNCRFLFVCHGVTNLIGLGDSEVIYTCLPLYHLSGGIIGAGLCLTMGHSIAIRHKFSAKNFWNDCIKYRCTVAQYIGEICRYLLCQPESPADRAHNVRCMFGNGLRLNIWKEFVERFNIERIGEFYGATEGNANVVNVNNKIGACGFVSQMLPGPLTDLFYPVSIIKVDEVTGEPLRKPNGLCIRCGPGDTGEFVGKIYPDDPTRAFDGYANREASDKKIIRNVFKHGDAFFSSGDLLTLDEFGYAFFKDRTGDTFRWKGENVSTTEVEAAIGSYLEHVDCVVYGVEIPGCEGRAGMAAILDPDDKVDVNKLLAEIRNVLPSYSIPTFVRKCQDFTTTATFKLPKVTLRNQAFDPSIVPDPIYYYDIRRGQYVKLDQQAYKQIKDGQIRF